MNTTIKLAVASALSLGAVAAHADIAANNTGSSTMIGFAEVITSSGATVASFAVNLGVSVSAAYSGTTTAALGNGASLSALFAADVPGDTIVWGVEGGQYTGTNNQTVQEKAGSTMNVTTAGNPTQITTKTSPSLVNQNNSLANAISLLNPNIDTNGNGTSVEGSAPSTTGVWDLNGGATNIYNWSGAGPVSAITGVGTAALYDMTGNGSLTAKLTEITNGSVSFSAAGFQFSANGTPPPPVPLPPAVWLLGSGLLGLAGVARRKATKA